VLCQAVSVTVGLELQVHAGAVPLQLCQQAVSTNASNVCMNQETCSATVVTWQSSSGPVSTST
jgi:hypothetical protein